MRTTATSPSKRRGGIAEELTARLTAPQVAMHYGFEPNRAGFIRCPFHQGDRTASLKLYPGDRGWCCFGCRRGGSVISFVMELFHITFPQAVVRLDADFHLGLTGKKLTPGQRARAAEERRQEEAERERERQKYWEMVREYWYWREIVRDFAPTREEWEAGWLHPFWMEGLERLPRLEWWLEEHLEGGERHQ